LGFKKTIDNPREPLKCWGCGEPHLLRNCPHQNSTNRTIQNIQEASTIGDIGKSIHRINAALDDRQTNHQSTIVEIEGKIHDRKVSILIDPGASLSYITPSLVDSCKLEKVKHSKSWLVQLATTAKRKVTEFISDCKLEISGHDTKVNLNILPLGSYDILIGMDWLEMHKFLLDYYEKSFTYKDESDITRTIKGICKIVSIRKISTLQLKKCIRKGCKLYVIQVTSLLNEESKPKLEYFLFFKNFGMYLQKKYQNYLREERYIFLLIYYLDLHRYQKHHTE
jgi:predicted aspartyl protease